MLVSLNTQEQNVSFPPIVFISVVFFQREFILFQIFIMWMVTDDGIRLETNEAQEEVDHIIGEEELVENYDDENNDERIDRHTN